MTLHLVDKSAHGQLPYDPQAASLLNALAIEGEVAICEVVALELLYSSRGPGDYETLWQHLQAFVWLPMNADVGRVALDIQRKLAKRGEHRRPIPDLLIAAAAIVHGATVLHYDKDFDLIAEVVDLSARWIIPRGTGHGG